MRNAKEIAIAGVPVDPIIKCVRCHKVGAEDDAAVLYDTARPNEQRSNRSDIGFHDAAQHLFEPIIIDSFDVVIQQTEDIGIYRVGGKIV